MNRRAIFLFDQLFSFQDCLHEFPFVIRVENPEREMNKLRFGHVKNISVFVHFYPLDHIPLNGHAFSYIELHQDLATIDLVGKFFENHFILLHLGHSGKLYCPEEHIKAISNNGSYKPPNGSNPEESQANG